MESANDNAVPHLQVINVCDKKTNITDFNEVISYLYIWFIWSKHNEEKKMLGREKPYAKLLIHPFDVLYVTFGGSHLPLPVV